MNINVNASQDMLERDVKLIWTCVKIHHVKMAEPVKITEITLLVPVYLDTLVKTVLRHCVVIQTPALLVVTTQHVVMMTQLDVYAVVQKATQEIDVKLHLILVIVIHVLTWAPVMPLVIISSVTARQGLPEMIVQFVP